jgi:hypothetical protein
LQTVASATGALARPNAGGTAMKLVHVESEPDWLQVCIGPGKFVHVQKVSDPLYRSLRVRIGPGGLVDVEKTSGSLHI